MLGPWYLSSKQVCSQLHDEVVGWNTAIHPERERKFTQLHCSSLNYNGIREIDTCNALAMKPNWISGGWVLKKNHSVISHLLAETQIPQSDIVGWNIKRLWGDYESQMSTLGLSAYITTIRFPLIPKGDEENGTWSLWWECKFLSAWSHIAACSCKE